MTNGDGEAVVRYIKNCTSGFISKVAKKFVLASTTVQTPFSMNIEKVPTLYNWN
tara:strand:+ start:362 stop:523 length:162 start_codon:yes stop_codon:yes gene_type:complete